MNSHDAASVQYYTHVFSFILWLHWEVKPRYYWSFLLTSVAWCFCCFAEKFLTHSGDVSNVSPHVLAASDPRALALFRMLWSQQRRCQARKLLKDIMLPSQIHNRKKNIHPARTRTRVSCFLSAPCWTGSELDPAVPSTGREGAGVFVIMGFEWQSTLISELKHCGDLNQSNNMSVETESEGKCYFFPPLTLVFLSRRHPTKSQTVNSFRFPSCQLDTKSVAVGLFHHSHQEVVNCRTPCRLLFWLVGEKLID